MSNISYIRVLQAIELFASEHLQVKKFASDFPSQMPNFGNNDEEYPILFVSPSDSIFNVNSNTFDLKVYCFDIIEKDRSNINTILSDTNQVLNDLVIWLRDGRLEGMDVLEVSTAIPINNALLDFASGWEMTVRIETDTYTLCDIPFNNFPIVSGITNFISYSKYITCDTLEDCPVIQGMQNQIEMILTGSTIDTFLTGGTYTNSNGSLTLRRSNGASFSVSGFTTGGTGNAVLSGGVTNQITKWASATGVTNSNISDDGTFIRMTGFTKIFGPITTDAFIKSNGTNQQILLADGSVTDFASVVSGGQLVVFNWKYSTNTSQSDPGNGNFRANNISAPSINKLYINDICADVQMDISTMFSKVNGDWLIHIQQANDATRFVQFTTSTAYTDNTGWWTLPVNYVQSGGASLTNLTKCSFIFVNQNAINNDTYTTGFTFNNSTYDLQIKRNDNITLTANLGILATDIKVTGGTYNPASGIVTFTNNTGGTFTVNGFTTGMTDTFTTGGTYSNGTITFGKNIGSNYTVTGLLTPETLQQVTNNGNITTNSITTTGFIKSGGTQNQFLKADGSVDSNTYVKTGQTININGVIQNLSGNTSFRTAQADTGILNYGTGITVASTTAINISAMDGYIVDNETNPTIPTYQYINYLGNQAVTVTTLSSGTESFVFLDSNGISFQNTFPTSTQRKQKIWIGKVSHPAGTAITLTINEPDFITSPLAQYRDLFQVLGPYINNGVYAYANGSNLNINITSGSINGDGINLQNSKTNPNQLMMGPGVVQSFSYRTQTGGTTTGVTIVDGSKYDVGGVITNVGGGVNSSTNQYIFAVPGVGYVIQYGQVIYSTLATAISNVGKESFVLTPNLIGNTILIGVLSINKNATDLSNTAQASFFKADKFGQIIGAVGGTSTSTLQNAYNNSLAPQIVTNSTLGSFQLQRGSASDSDIVLDILNGSSVSKFRIDGNGSVTGQSFVKSGGTSSQFLKADGSVDTTVYITAFTDTYSTAVTYTNNVITVKRNNNLPDMSILINTMTGLTVTGALTAGTIVKSGGTSAQFLKADGSVDSTVYYPNSNPNGYTTNAGTVTNVAQLTIGTVGTDISSTVLNPTTSAVITLNVPTASASNRGALSSTDWSTFNNKQATLVSGTNIKTINGNSLLGSGDLVISGTGGTDIRVTGGTYVKNTGIITFTNNTGGTFTVTGIIDVFVTGGTHNSGTGISTFTNNTGGTFTVSGYSTGGTIGGSGTVTGTGIANFVSKWISTSGQGNSNIIDNGSLVTISSATNVIGAITGTSIIKAGGTSAQYLMADGSVSTGTGGFDNYTTGGTYSSGTLSLRDKSGQTITVTGFTSGGGGGITNTATTNTVPLTIDGSGNLGTSLITQTGNTIYIGNNLTGITTFANTTIDFENGLLSPFTSSAATPWFIQSAVTHNGRYAAKSGNISDSQNTFMQIQVTPTGSSSISFYYKVSSEGGSDYLTVTNNGVEKLGFGDGTYGEVDWTLKTFTLNAGVLNTIVFKYQKDSSVSSGTDSIYIDDIVITNISSTGITNNGSLLINNLKGLKEGLLSADINGNIIRTATQYVTSNITSANVVPKISASTILIAGGITDTWVTGSGGGVQLLGDVAIGNTLYNTNGGNISGFQNVSLSPTFDQAVFSVNPSGTYFYLRRYDQLITSANGVRYTLGINNYNTSITTELITLYTGNSVSIGTGITTADSVNTLRVNGDVLFSGVVKTTKTIRLNGYTVSTLPAGTIGDTAYVTDALTPTYLGALVGGGAIKTPVFYNGTAWVSY